MNKQERDEALNRSFHAIPSNYTRISPIEGIRKVMKNIRIAESIPVLGEFVKLAEVDSGVAEVRGALEFGEAVANLIDKEEVSIKELQSEKYRYNDHTNISPGIDLVPKQDVGYFEPHSNATSQAYSHDVNVARQ